LPRTRAQDDQLNARVASSAGAKSSRHKKNSDRQQETGASLSRANAASHYAQKRKKRRRLGAVKVIVAVVAAVLVGGGVAAWAYVNNIQSKLSSGIDSALRGQLTTTETGQPFYMLLLGVDKNADRENSSEYGSADSAYRSDSIMLARIDPQSKKVTLVSIHRDTAVNITYTDSSGKTVTANKEKINAAYSLGGPSCCVSTVSQFAGVNISHYAEVDFDSFCDIVNTIGGIEVDVPVDVYDPEYTGADIKAGVQTLDGDQALQLCRARHAYDKYGDGDLYRAANQRAVIAAIMRKIMKMDPASMTGVISQLAGSVTTDMSVGDIVSLGTQMSGIDIDNDVYSGMAPTTSSYTNNTWYEICNQSAWKTMMERVDQGLPPYETESQDPTAGVSSGIAVDTSSATTNSATTVAVTSNVPTSSDSTDYSGTVEVLNASGLKGYASGVANLLTSKGFTTTTDNAKSSATKTVVVYNGSNQAKANAVALAMGGSITVQNNDGSYDTSADVIVTLGSDQVAKTK
jgi:LCP family protein required for cell wall assembly